MSSRYSIKSQFVGLTVFTTVLFSAGCTDSQQNPDQSGVASNLEWLAFRVRNDASVGLNEDAGWAAPENTAADILYDQPFRFRVQVRASATPPEGHLSGLQYRQQGQVWLPVGFAEFPYPDFATPVMSVISTVAYINGEETGRLLGSAEVDWDDGAGLNAVAFTPVWRAGNDAVEWEWPLVIRRFSDGPTFAEDGAIFELRVVDGYGQPLTGQAVAELRLNAPPRHLGGTFIETPGRLGPYQSDEGHLYFFMEPSETDNRFMAIKSTDFGLTWRETNGARRPVADDLEGVASVRTGNTIHLIHQVSREVFYHAFEIGSDESGLDAWRVDSQSIATPDEPPTQFADIVARSDGSLVTLYGGATRLFLQTRSAQGTWSAPVEIDAEVEPVLSGPVMATGPDDVVTLAYTGMDGSGFIRHLHPDGSLSERHPFSTNLGSADSENGAIIPLVVLPESGTTVVLYREQNGLLYERRFSRDGQLSDPVQVAPLTVVTNAVDSEQAGADLILHESTLHLLFIEEQSGSIFHSRSDEAGIWSPPRALIENIQAGWVRGSVHLDAAGNQVYGFVYDAGSTGGSGFNRYFSILL
ncbi:MAG: exo-alpha-sialidase [Pseudohongiella sp.]|nr:exo-alpha-sialidase [Pseudohongiella sp.]